MCSHSGRIEEGWNYFKSMSRIYGINPMEELLACMVDLLGLGWDDRRSFILASDIPGEPGASDNGEDDIRN